MSKRCLIVDDSRMVRRVASRIIRELQFDILEAENGHEGLKLCQVKLPDVVLLDWNMPSMTGYQFLQKLRALPEGEQPIVIFCTVEKDVEKIRLALEAGANEYIMKPFDADIIRGKFVQTGVLAA